MATNIPEIIDSLDLVRFNPSAIQQIVLGVLEETTNGKRDIVDPSNPFVFLLESGAVMLATHMIGSEAIARKLYGSMALTEDELYLHMSDKDYINRFVTPSRASFYFHFSKEEIYAKAVDTGVGNIRKITIPRHTEVQVAGYKFTMQYPIEIRIMGHGGLQIVYDVEKTSPIQTLESNIVKWDIVSIDQVEYVRLNVPMTQFGIATYYGQLNASTTFSKTYDLEDDFYYCRVFQSNSDGSWSEIKTTHTDQVFDPLTPTAVLKVANGQLNVRIPQVYFNTNLVNRELRIDIYTSKGPLDLILSNYAPNSYGITWTDLDGDDGGIYVAPLPTFSTMAIYSLSTVAGGADALTFEELRQRMINNSLGSTNLPITNVQVGNLLADLGYDVVKNVDVVTNRNFLTTRRLPQPSDKSVISGASCSMNTVSLKVEEVVALDTVADNGNRVTLLPNTLYESISGVVKPVSALERESLLSMAIDILANQVNQRQFLYTPFHYVLDSNKNAFELRPYYLDNPLIDSKLFIEENDTVGLEVGTSEYGITRIDGGYRLIVVTRSGDLFKELSDDTVFAQLSFVPNSESTRAYLNGTLIGRNGDNERIYQFDLITNYDIDEKHGLYLTNFVMYEDVTNIFATSLLGEFDLVYGVLDSTNPDMVSSNIDRAVKASLLDGDPTGIIQERYRIRLGYALESLWSNSRTVVSGIDYLTYDVDVPAYYTENVYERDPVTGIIKLSLDTDGTTVIYSILHNAGDPVLDSEGNQVYSHLAGEPVLDNDGNPIPASPRKLVRQMDLFMVEGNYYFATETVAREYGDSVPNTVVSWLTEDLEGISGNLLEQTDLFFYPQNTQGDVKVIIGEGQETKLPAEQSFTVTFYLTRTGYVNTDLRNVLTDTAVSTIAEALVNPIVTINGIVSKLTALAGDDVISIDVTGLGGDKDLMAVTVVDDSARLAIKKRLATRADNTLTVEDDVEVIFIRHEV